jgi:Icc protein
MVTGDLVQEVTADAYQHFRRLFESFRVPVLCLPGNHDDPALMRAALTEFPFTLDHRVPVGAWDIIQLDSHLPGSAAGEVGEAELNRLEDSLQGNHARPTLVAVHHQPRPVGTRWLDGVGLRDGESLLACVQRHEHVKAVLWGHVHQAARYDLGSIRMMCTPSTCAQFLAGSDDFAIDDQAQPAYRVLWLGDDGRIDDELIELPARSQA